MHRKLTSTLPPYFDDFDPQSNYYKVLFKLAYPVQARELNNLNPFFKIKLKIWETTSSKKELKVIPSQLTYLPKFYGIQIDPEFLGIPVDLYLDQIVGKRITGATSGVTAKVVTYITDKESERGVFTLYVDYLESSIR